MVDQSDSDFKVAADNRVSSQPHAQREPVMCSGGSGIIEPATGASPSNTAPSNYTEVQILHQGVDSLYLNYAGSLTVSADTRLEYLKGLAQSPDAVENELMELGGWSSFEVVLRYAHMAGDHLKKAACHVEGTILTQSGHKKGLHLVASL